MLLSSALQAASADEPGTRSGTRERFRSLATFYEELESQFVGREPKSRARRSRGALQRG